MSEQFEDEFEECEVIQVKEAVVQYGQETLIERVTNKDQVREEENMARYLDGEEKIYQLRTINRTRENMEK